MSHVQGGPGGSGVELLSTPGIVEQLSAGLGDDFDHVSFDPRGELDISLHI